MSHAVVPPIPGTCEIGPCEDVQIGMGQINPAIEDCHINVNRLALTSDRVPIRDFIVMRDRKEGDSHSSNPGRGGLPIRQRNLAVSFDGTNTGILS